MVVSIDAIRESEGFYWGTKEPDASEWQKIFAEANTTIVQSLKFGKSVVYDSANQDRASRDRLTKLGQSCGCETRLIFFDVPREVIMQRRSESQQQKSRHHIPDSFFNAALDTFESPTQDEHPTSPEQYS